MRKKPLSHYEQTTFAIYDRDFEAVVKLQFGFSWNDIVIWVWTKCSDMCPSRREDERYTEAGKKISVVEQTQMQN